MALTYNANTIGKLTIEQTNNESKKRYTIDIRQGNALAVFVHVRKANITELQIDPNGKYIHTLYTFFGDEQHIKNIMKHNNGKCLFDKVVKIELNMYFKEARTLLKYFTLSGYRVTCYYKEVAKSTDFDFQR